ncbi:MAG: hypothetical protein NTZ61_04395, partial [Proteobacteria bacterium]|nr:hypothetical protein [Pseudomonadota bacterium]
QVILDRQGGVDTLEIKVEVSDKIPSLDGRKARGALRAEIIRCLKAALNADCDGQAGLQELAGNATMLFYMSEEAQEGRDAYLEKRAPDFSRFPWRP